MLLLCTPLLAASLVCAAVSPEEIRPTKKAPFVQPAEAQRAETHAAIKAYMAKEPGTFGAHPSAEDFPGAVEAATRVERTVAYDPNLLTRWDTAAGNAPNLATGPDVWQETGLYAAPGEVVKVTAPTIPEGRTVKVIVGCHRDGLLKLDKWQRFPVITRSFELRPGANKIANAFGGQLFIQVKAKEPRQAKDKVATGAELRFEHAVEAPTYVLGQDTPDRWAKARLAPAPWATLVGRNAILHVQSSEIRQLDDPAQLLEWWDQVIALEDDLVALRRLAPERVVPDRQISAGFMHSGYPFMCILGASQKEITDLARLRQAGNWGFFHELGHNHQRRDWTFENQTEVTCNLFSLYVMERLIDQPVGRGHPALQDLDRLLARRFAEPPELGPFEQLGGFIVLLRAHGWAALRTTLRSYASEPVKKDLPKDELKNIFVQRYGHAAQADVSGYFVRLGYPVTETTRRALGKYPAFDPALPKPTK